MLNLQISGLIVLLIVLVIFLHRNMRSRERANQIAMAACQRMELQFLDGTVAFAHYKLVRNPVGGLQLYRTYVFDYTRIDTQRQQGFIVMCGSTLISIGFAAAEARASAALVATLNTQERTASGHSNVLDLAEWRRTHSQTPTTQDDKRDTWH